MTQQDCIDRVLESFVRFMIEAGDIPLLEEDNDSSHGTKKSGNKVWKYKECIDLNWYANPSRSPDFCPLEKIWKVVKQRIKEQNFSEEESLRETIVSA
jgi:hypothetical protein